MAGDYSGLKAAQYDTLSEVNKGNREYHRHVLRDILAYREETGTFCDLGCGTGSFSGVILEAVSGARGIGVDASVDMLARAEVNLAEFAVRFQTRRARIEEIEWWQYEKQFDLVFSALTLHHLDDRQKWACFSGVYRALRPGGWFVLYDLMSTGDAVSDGLLEHLACSDIVRRVRGSLSDGSEDDEISLARIVDRDRQMRSEDGDQEAGLDIQMTKLQRIGFKPVVVVFQEARQFGLVAMKGN
jgi:tRNA (cmo5U34)-methyltransferase